MREWWRKRAGHPAIPIVLAAVMIDIMGFGIVMPVLPSLVTRLGHIDLAEATRVSGWMLAAYALAQFVAGPVLGALGDRYGRRPVLIYSMVSFAIDYGLMAWAPSLAWLFVGRVIAGVAGATIGPAGAVIADVTPPEDRAASFGLLGAGFGIGFILGPAFGGLVAGLGPRAPFIVSAMLAGINALFMFIALPETLAVQNRRAFSWRDATVVGAFRPVFRAGNAAPLLIAWLLWQLGGAVYPATWAFWASMRFGWTAAQIGLSLAWVGLLMGSMQIFATGHVVRWLGERRTASIGLAGSTACFLAYAFTTQGWQVYVFFLIGALGALAWPAMNGLLSRLAGADEQGGLQGGIGSINAIAQVLGPLIAAQALAAGSGVGFLGAAFLVSAALTASAAMIIGYFLPVLERAEA